MFALLQSFCTAVFAISGLRVVIGLTGLAAVSGIFAPIGRFHQDAIRIPMLAIGAIGAIVNLAVLLRVWSLRRRASGNWRRRTISAKERRSERLQLALAILTLLLVGMEVWTHAILHRPGPPPVQITSR
jgi:formate hydrogenlyase subunit 3/multisubunit Na+/H+ antiporter MnhD subunit